MRSPVSLLALLAAVSMCHGQTTTYITSGIVKDKSGAPIVGASVTFQVGKVSTTTDADGKFDFGQTSSISDHPADRVAGNLRSLALGNGGCIISVSGKSVLTLDLYNGRGQVLSSERRTVDAGTHALAIPRHGSGLALCRVGIDNEHYVFTSVDMGQSYRPTALRGGADAAGGPVTLAKAGAKSKDVIIVKQAGYLDYRLLLTNPDTTGLNLVMLPSEGDLTDIDGNVYQTVKIGTQVWTATNFKATKFNDGTPIPSGEAGGWGGQSMAYCYYGNNPVLGAKFGALYNGGAGRSPKLPPKGWHIPTVAEWDTLVSYLQRNGYNSIDTSENFTAKAVAAREEWGWAPDGPAQTYPYQTGYDIRTNNASGFALLPAGMRIHGNAFSYMGYHTWIWRAESAVRSLGAAFWGLWAYGAGDDNGCSVRLIRDN